MYQRTEGILMNIRRRLSISLSMILLAAACAVTAIAASGTESPAREGFLLKAYEGHVAVFEPGCGKDPAFITGIELDSLTQADRALLEAGLSAASQPELAALLEDLGS